MVALKFTPAEVCKELIGFGYEEGLTEKILLDSLNNGVQDHCFTNLVIWLCNEISILYELDERVQLTGDKPEDIECYLLELSSLISELDCPYEDLSSGPLIERFGSVENLQKLLLFLIGHLRCARLTAVDRLNRGNIQSKRSEVVYVENALKSLSSAPPPPDLTAEQLFRKFGNLVEKQFGKCKERPKPLFVAALTDSQWARVGEINERLMHEYHCRMQLLLKRLDVTIQSFVWSERIKKMEDKVYDVYRPRRDSIIISANIGMGDLLAATTDLLVVEKVMGSRQRERTASRLNKVLMSDRPGDRGGRPSELRAPPPEMPAWRKDRVPDPFRGGARDNRFPRGGGDFRGSGASRNTSFENQVMGEYEAANRRQQAGYGFQSYQDGTYDVGQRSRGRYYGGRGGRGYSRY